MISQTLQTGRIQPAIINTLAEGDIDLTTSEVGNGRRFVRQHGNRIRFSFTQGCWLIYDGARWRRDDRQEIIRLAKETARTIYTEAGQCADDGQRRMLSAHAQSTESFSKLQAMVRLAVSEDGVGVAENDLDVDPMLLNVANGTVDLATGKLRSHSPKDLLTKITPIEHDAQAECPRWMQFLQEITAGDEALQRYLAQLAGYCLTGSTEEQAFFLMVGGGSNGKSVFLHVLRKLLGEYASTTDFGTFSSRRANGIRNDLAKLKGNRLALCSEIEAGERLAEAVMKQITGGDEISVRKLYGEFFEYLPQYKVVLATNHLPALVGSGDGIWRRPQVIPFDVTFTKEQQDPTLTGKLLAELPGILNWAIEGCLSWRNWTRLDVPQAVLKANRAYRDEMDSVFSFINDECVMEPGAKTEARELHTAYVARCERAGVDAWNIRVFGSRLTETYHLGSHKNGRGNIDRIGIRLKTLAERAEEDAAPALPQVVAAGAIRVEEPALTVEPEYDPFADMDY